MHSSACHSNSSNHPPRLRLPEAARYIGVAPRSLADRAWRRRHGLDRATIKIGRLVVFDRATLDAWLRRHTERLPAAVARATEGGAR